MAVRKTQQKTQPVPPERSERWGRVWRGLLYWCTGLLLLIAPLGLASYWISAVGTRPIMHVSVDGSLRHLTPNQLKQLLDPSLELGFFGMDISQVRASLQALPWVDQASVRRLWPNRLELTISEHVPRARWGANELLSYTGERFLPPATTFPQDLPYLDGPVDTESRVLEHYIGFTDLLKIVGLGVQGVSVDSRGSWRLVLDNGLVMLLGRERMKKRLWRLARVYAVVVKPRVVDIERVDLRYSNGFAVSWRTTEPNL